MDVFGIPLHEVIFWNMRCRRFGVHFNMKSCSEYMLSNYYWRK